MPIDWTANVIGQTITDLQKQSFSAPPGDLPAGAVAGAFEYVIVLGNGRTVRITAIKTAAGVPRLAASLERIPAPVMDTELA